MTITTKIMATVSAMVVSFGMAFSASAPAEAGGVITVPEADWTGGRVTCKVLQFILEDEMDYKIKLITMPAGPGVSEGMRSGDLDFACESWPSYAPTKGKYIAEWGGDGSLVKLGDAGIIGVSGYYVPHYLVEGADAKAPNLKKLTDLNMYKDLFKALETGDRGRIVGCPVAAWPCEDTARMAGLGVDFVAVELGSETAHSDISRRHPRLSALPG